jgi:signal transduction histidine kinase
MVEARADVGDIHKAGLDAHRLLNDVLDFAAVQQGKLRITAAPLMIRPFISALARAHAALAASEVRMLHLVCPALPADLGATTDSLRLQQIIANGK